MKIYKLLVTTLIILFSELAFCQNNKKFTCQDSISDTDFMQFNTDDLREALVMKGINVFKWELPLPKSDKQTLILYLQEYKKTQLISEKMIKKIPTKYKQFNSEGNIEYQHIKTLRIISKSLNKTGNPINLQFSLNSGKYNFSTNLAPHSQNDKYSLNKFQEKYFGIGEYIPLLLFTSAETNKGSIPNKLSNNKITKANHYYIIGYRVIDHNFPFGN
jgi:hypothetical protein